ncbi:hypothetical protein [Nitrosococcus wardiae]|uniref:Uncharacterized protein n=1 Tax=Nitrosococcus wardiae TaxID=1814290 RepID=A0A4P7BVB4_9GAMM|nr:hypothetical protein [Nitrosococcus wardiae]QBQ53943.1 hypothetical protein E3U44_05025 [Nitrosococcus wardiae]
MEISWILVKEVFFSLGSAAGVLALLRPVLESKHQRDLKRAQRILDLLPEQRIIDLEPCLYQLREVPKSFFDPFDQILHEVRTNQEGVRFSGPVRKHLSRELVAIQTGYQRLRTLVQVPEWEPYSRTEDGMERYYWRFNKDAFADESGIPKNYAQHLDECVDHAREITRAYQRFQIASEIHLLETPVARYLLSRRFREHGVG